MAATPIIKSWRLIESLASAAIAMTVKPVLASTLRFCRRVQPQVLGEYT
jgi:hypothetical protein